MRSRLATQLRSGLTGTNEIGLSAIFTSSRCMLVGFPKGCHPLPTRSRHRPTSCHHVRRHHTHTHTFQKQANTNNNTQPTYLHSTPPPSSSPLPWLSFRHVVERAWGALGGSAGFRSPTLTPSDTTQPRCLGRPSSLPIYADQFSAFRPAPFFAFPLGHLVLIDSAGRQTRWGAAISASGAQPTYIRLRSSPPRCIRHCPVLVVAGPGP